ncbi:MAG: hypothetical protein ACLQVD_06405, partial [Capsulimonadaceae bacterium]
MPDLLPVIDDGGHGSTGASPRVARVGAFLLGFLGLLLLFARVVATRLHSGAGDALALAAW